MKGVSFTILTLTLIVFPGIFCLAQKEPIRIACIGNSITYGYLLNNPELDSYPGQLNSMLGSDFDVRNFGVSSRTMLKKGDYPYWNEPEFTEALNFNPDTVIILLGGNDTKAHNWQYKDEFISDYIAMIDTFQQLESDPDIWICYPSPGFGGWAFAETIYVSEIIPMIDQVLEQREVSLIDFHTPMVNIPDYFPDGIHPTIEGSGYMAKIVYQILTGKEISMVQDVDVALNKSVTASGYLGDYPPDGLVDRDSNTSWACEDIPSWVVLNLEITQTIDMFQFNFSNNKGIGYQYIIEVSQDSINWVTVVDQSARSDTSISFCTDTIDPIDAQYVKFTITDALYDDGEGVEIWEFSVFKYSNAIHAPLVTYNVIRESSRLLEIELGAIPTTNDGEAVAIYRKKPGDTQFRALTGYRSTDQEKEKITVKKEDIHFFYATAFKDGKEVISDTIQIGDPAAPIRNMGSVFPYPTSVELYANYPNPFNQNTKLGYSTGRKQSIRLSVYNILGEKVAVLTDGIKYPGTHFIQFDASGLTSGTYFYCLEAGPNILTKKMLFIK
jgi:lysophospholipase L1-like esterase